MIQPARVTVQTPPLEAVEPPDQVAVVAVGTGPSTRDDVVRLLDAMPPDCAAAFLIFDISDTSVADPGPLTPEGLNRSLQHRSAAWLEDGMVVKPGAVLLADRSMHVALLGDTLLVEPGGGPYALDAFVFSLARTERAAAMVLLEAPAFAGALAASALRARGGLVLAGQAAGAMLGEPGHVTSIADTAASLLAHLAEQTTAPAVPAAPPVPAAHADLPTAAEWEHFAASILPKLIRNRPEGSRLRVWVLGCGTGEAVYHLAMTLRDQLGSRGVSLQIFATDVDSQALAAARTGCYSEAFAKDVPPSQLGRWFIHKGGGTYVAKPELRELCIFSAHNVLRDPPFSRIDLILCRTLPGALGAPLQDRMVRALHFALSPEGVLWLGEAGSAALPAALFDGLPGEAALYRPRQTTGSETVPAALVLKRFETPAPPRWRQADYAEMTAAAERMAAAHGPPYVIVNSALEVMHLSARMGRFLAFPPGEATLNLLQLMPRDLRPHFSALLEHVALTGQPAQTGRLQMSAETGRIGVTLLAEPMGEGPAHRFVIMFKTGSDDTDSGPGAASLVEEELRTSREELRSLSEEFNMVSHELADRMAELTRANSDLQNVLQSTRIALVFLDDSLLLQSFTPAADDVVHLRESDVGRPFADLALRIDYPGLMQDAQKVLRTLTPIEREAVAAPDGKRYLVRMLPYRRVDNFIAGIVITFFDITATYEAERARRDSEERFRVMADVVPAFLFIADSQGEWQYVNPPFYAFTGLSSGAALGEGWWSAVHAEDAELGRRIWHDAIQGRSELEVELRLRRGKAGGEGDESWFVLRAVPRLDASGAVLGWFGSCIDIDARWRAVRSQRQLLSELQHRVKNVLAVVRSVVTRTVRSSKTLDELSAHLSGRINAIARVQSVIARNAGNGVVLSELIDEEFAAHGGHIDQQTDISGPVVLLTEKAAESLGLALHELTTNAIKYGAFSVLNGRLSVRWRLYPAGVDNPQQQGLVLEWQESGVPVTDLQPWRSGFGRELLESALPYEIGASTTLEFLPGGARWVIQVMLAGPPYGRLSVNADG